MDILAWLGGVWGLLWTIALLAILVTSVEFESAAAAWIALAVFLVIGEWTGITAVWPWIVENPLRLIGVAIVYVGVGALWSMFKLKRELMRRKYDLDSSRGDSASSIAQRIVRDYKARLLLWTSMWPVSMLWWVASDAFKYVWDAVYDALSSVYERIALSAVEIYAREEAAKKAASAREQPK